MNIDEAMSIHVVTNITKVSGRVFMLVAPDTAKMPYIVLQRISNPPTHAMGTDPAIFQPRVQLTVWDDDYPGVQTVVADVITYFKDYTGTMGGTGGVAVQRVFFEGSTPVFEDKQYGERMEFTVWY